MVCLHLVVLNYSNTAPSLRHARYNPGDRSRTMDSTYSINSDDLNEFNATGSLQNYSRNASRMSHQSLASTRSQRASSAGIGSLRTGEMVPTYMHNHDAAHAPSLSTSTNGDRRRYGCGCDVWKHKFHCLDESHLLSNCNGHDISW